MVISAAPLVSIVTPVYNGSEYLEALIRSVQNQDYPNIEHIVIDDGSQDHGATISILRKYPHLRWRSRANQGQYATMNEGLLTAKGEIICFVSADDIVSPNAVSLAVEFLKKHPDYDGVFGMTSRIDIQGKVIPYYIPFQTAPLSFYPYFAHISHCSLYVKKFSLQKHNLMFDSSLNYVGDYEWIIRILKARLRIGLLRYELSKVRLHINQASQRYASRSRMETEKVIARHHINRSSFAFLNGLYRLLFKAWYVAEALKNGEMTVLIKRRIKNNGR